MQRVFSTVGYFFKPLARIGVLFTLLLAAHGAHAGLWGSVEFKAESIDALPQWVKVLEKIKTEQARFAACDEMPTRCPSPSMLAWRSKIKSLKDEPLEKQLQQINRFANQWAYRFDYDAWGASDYWASPSEFLRNSGDCEDYAILKYFSLKEMGVPVKNMRIAVVQDTLRNMAHAVLVVRVDDQEMVLDSLFNAVLPDTEISQYIPQYSINENTRWAHILPLEPAAASAK